MRSLENQQAAAHGLWVWLSEQPISELTTSLLGILETYQLELARQLAGDPVEQEWLGVLYLAAIEAKLTTDELLEMNPGLEAYGPENEPQDFEQMAIRLLADAVRLFDATVDGRVYLDIPEVAIEIDKFVKRVLTAQELSK